MISSALGKNEHDKTLSEKGTGKLSKRFYGIKLVKILDKLDKNHCINSIDLTKGEWIDTRIKVKNGKINIPAPAIIITRIFTKFEAYYRS